MRASFWLALCVATLMILWAAPHALTQQPESLDALSYRAFSGLVTVYRQGGQSPELVAKLNQALGLIDEAHLKLLQGKGADASKLQGQANSLLTDVFNQTPAEQQRAANERTVKTWLTVGMVPVAVLLSTLLFYASLTTWRRYEKSHLFEMRIIRVVPDETKD
jgi:hypothetical protein